jgi:hypothetical protein
LGGYSCRNIGRLNADGTGDSGFDPEANQTVGAVAVQADGKILVGGEFTFLAGQPRNYLGRLTNTESASESLSCSSSTITWLRSGASPEVWRTSFESSTNAGANWANLGEGTRIPGGWQLRGILVPQNSAIRARGFVTGGSNNGSTWFVESLLQLGLPPPPIILVNDGHFGVSNGHFGFNFQAQLGQVVMIEASTNLHQWWVLQTNTLGIAPLYFRDLQWTNYPARFYRLRLP